MPSVRCHHFFRETSLEFVMFFFEVVGRFGKPHGRFLWEIWLDSYWSDVNCGFLLQFRLTELRLWEKWGNEITSKSRSKTQQLNEQKRHNFSMGSLDIYSLQQDSISFIVHPPNIVIWFSPFQRGVSKSSLEDLSAPQPCRTKATRNGRGWQGTENGYECDATIYTLRRFMMIALWRRLEKV